MKKFAIVSLMSLSLLGTSLFITAASASQVSNDTPTHEVTPRVKWSGSAYLTTKAYSNVTSSNNIFNDSPLVTNGAGNKGSIKVRVVNQSGKQVGSVKTIKKGKSGRMGSIPWNSGTYTLQAKAVSGAGRYSINID